MTRQRKLIGRILSGTSDNRIGFRELGRLLKRLGFRERIRGSHHIFTRDGVEEILNLQPKGNNAKPYQVEQVREVIIKYRLANGVQPGDASQEPKEDQDNGDQSSL